MAGCDVGLLKFVAVIAFVANFQRVLKRCEEVRAGHGPGLQGVAVGRDGDDVAGGHVSRRDAAADAASVLNSKVRARQGKIGAANHVADGLGLGGIAFLAGTQIGGAHHLPAMRTRGVLAVEIVGGGCAEHLVRFAFKGIVEWLDFVVANLVKDVLVVRVCQKVVDVLGGVELLVAVACGDRHHVVVGGFGTPGVVLIGNGKQTNLGKGAACLDDADRLAVGPRHVFV